MRKPDFNRTTLEKTIDCIRIGLEEFKKKYLRKRKRRATLKVEGVVPCTGHRNKAPDPEDEENLG